MNTIAIAFLVCFFTVHCAVYKTFDGKLNRVARSPHFPKPPISPPENSPILFRTQNWSGVARGPNGASGVFSGAAAESDSPGAVPSEAVALATAGATPGQNKLEERFGGPHFHGHSHPHFSRGFRGFQDGGDFHYGSWGSSKQGFGKSQSFSNSDAGCNDDSHNGFNSDQQTNTVPISIFQANSNGEVGYAGRKQNGFSDGQYSSNNFNKVESSSSASGQSQGTDNFAVNGGQYQSNILNGKHQESTASKLSVPSQSNTDGQQVESFSNGIGQSQGLLNVKSSQNSDSQQFESHSTGFGSSQSLQNDGSQLAQAQGSVFGSTQSQSGSNGLGQSHSSLNTGSNGRSQSSQNGGSQPFESHDTNFGNSQGLQNYDSQETQTQSSGFSGAQSHSGFKSFGHSYGSLNTESNGRSRSDQNGAGQQFESHGTVFGSSQGLQNDDSQQVQSTGSSFDSAQRQIQSNGFVQDKGRNLGFHTRNENGNNEFRNSNTHFYYKRRGSGSSSLSGGNSRNFAYGKGGSAKYQAESQTQGAQEGSFSGHVSDSDNRLTSLGNVQGSLSSGSNTSGQEDIQSTLNGALNLASQGLEASQKTPCTTCQKGSYAFSNARSNSGSAIALSIGG